MKKAIFGATKDASKELEGLMVKSMRNSSARERRDQLKLKNLKYLEEKKLAEKPMTVKDGLNLFKKKKKQKLDLSLINRENSGIGSDSDLENELNESKVQAVDIERSFPDEPETVLKKEAELKKGSPNSKAYKPGIGISTATSDTQKVQIKGIKVKAKKLGETEKQTDQNSDDNEEDNESEESKNSSEIESEEEEENDKGLEIESKAIFKKSVIQPIQKSD